MLKDMTESFKKAVKKDRNIILDNYMLKDGIYIKLDRNRHINQIDENRYLIVDTKKEVPPEKLDLYNWLKERDYCSQILNTNKAIDLPAKKILSSNYLSYFIKKDRLPRVGNNELTMEGLKDLTDKYYTRLQNAEKYFEELIPLDFEFKGDKKEGLEEFLQTYFCKEVSYIRDNKRKENIEICKDYILDNMEHIIDIIKAIDEEFKIKEYIKIFFEEDIEKYRQEYKVYLIPRIYTVKDFNILVDDEILGLPISDMTINEKKPYLLLRTMNCTVPIRDTIKNVEITKNFYEWMTNRIKEEEEILKIGHKHMFDGGKSYNQEGPFYIVNMELNKSTKKYEIVDFDNIPTSLSTINFQLENVLRVPLFDHKRKVKIEGKYEENRNISNLSELQYLVSQYYFKGKMKGYFKDIEPEVEANKFTYSMKILFMESRDAFFDFFHKGIDTNIKKIIDKITLKSIEEQIKSTVEGTKLLNIKRAYNLRLSFLKYFKIKGGEDMDLKLENIIDGLKTKVDSKEMVYCNSDEEFYFMAGQLAYYLISQSEASNKNFGMFEPFLSVKNPNQLKRRLEETFETYSHKIPIGYIKFKNAMVMVMGYEIQNKITDKMKDLLIAGILSNNILYGKK